MPNHLLGQTSPYLLQHAHNPVDWYPWGQEALERAHAEDKPIFLSIGYAACHWCHVMAHESFEDPAIAELMNAAFINIKVDREERPDLDSIYMSAVVALSQQGGWPMSVFLTPDGHPFYGGTYYPPSPRYGMPSFREVLTAINRIWQTDRAQIYQVSDQLSDDLRKSTHQAHAHTLPLAQAHLDNAAQTLIQSYDWQFGGWGQAPRFPAPMTIEFLLQQAERGNESALKTALHFLKTMQRGGLYDVIGGGFHRYSTDDHWLVPHFEKMLYDNAQLALVYLHAFQITTDMSLRHTCEETLDFLLREMQHPLGGFFSSLDADSEGEEGLFYLWTKTEIEAILTDPSERELFFKAYSIPDAGNFEGKVILNQALSLAELASQTGKDPALIDQQINQCRAALLSRRSQRIRPLTDDKVLTVWNAFTIRVLAEAGSILENEKYLAAAEKSADFIQDHFVVEGRLRRSWREGHANIEAYLEDYAALIIALLSLYQANLNPRWYRWAKQLSHEMQAAFADPSGGFFDTSTTQEQLILRPKDLQDNATPSGNALASLALLQLSEFENWTELHAEVEKTLESTIDIFVKYPSAFSFWLQAANFAVGPIRQIAVVWPKENAHPRDMLQWIRQVYRTRVVLAASPYPPEPDHPALLDDRSPLSAEATVFVCQGFVCNLPVSSLSKLQNLLN